ncbi:cytochrome P450 [Pseudomonadota bacterium]
MTKNPVRVLETYRKEYGHTFSFHFGGSRRSIVSSDPSFIEHVLRQNYNNYHKSDIQVDRMSEFQGKGLVNYNGDQWRRQRRLLARGFHTSRLREILELQISVVDNWMPGFETAAGAGVVDVYKHMVSLTLCLVGYSLFGRNMAEEELDEIAATIATIQRFIVREIVHPYLIPWYKLSGQNRRYQKLRRKADAIVLRHIQARRNEGIGSTDFLRILLETPYSDTGETMSEEQALIESLQLLVAGNETSSIALTWVCFLLGSHPEYIPKIREEINNVIGEHPVDFDNLHQLDLTLRVIYESLRLYPPFWMIDRVSLRDDTINGINIPAGTMVIPYIYGTHRNPYIWPDPTVFDPGRFESARKKSRHRFSFIPFGGGPRICIGNNMAIMQILLVVVKLVQQFNFTLDSNHTVDIRPMMLLRPDGPVLMDFRKL